MSENNHDKFTCCRCGSHKLVYHEYVKHITPVDFMNRDNIYYAETIIDENDFIPELSGFCCGDCGHMLAYCDRPINTEIGLLAYLSLDSEVRTIEQGEYDEPLEARTDAAQD